MEKNLNMQPQAHCHQPPPAYERQPEGAAPTTTTYITAQPTIISRVVAVSTGPPVGPQPNRLNCPSCNADIVTRVEYKATPRTHCMAVILCCLCVPCVVVPYFMDSCNSAHHYCPNCGCYIGTYDR